MRRKTGASFDKIYFHILQVKFFLEILFHELPIQPIAASVEINADKFLLRKSMHADMRLGNHHKTGVTARILFVVARERNQLRIANLVHLGFFRQLVQTLKNQISVIQFNWISIITVNHQVHPEVDG